MMLEHLGETAASKEIETAIARVLGERGPTTPDLGGRATTQEVGGAIAAISSLLPVGIS
jgi:tartrate dehydrogenase/decarboxylase/D-malate dehydrogenase